MKFVSYAAMAGAALTLAACAHQEEEMAMAEPAMMTTDYVVYFGFGRSDLTTLGQATVDEVIGSAMSMSGAAVSIVGHTDTVGSTSFNQALSERRARTVGNAMIAGGVDAGRISASGRSENDLAVATGDNVREARNRRVEISLAGAAPMAAPAVDCELQANNNNECVRNGDDGVVMIHQ